VAVPEALPNMVISFQKNTRKTTTVHMENFNQQPSKRVLNKGVKKILPKKGCVMGAFVSFLVVSDKVHTQTHPSFYFHFLFRAIVYDYKYGPTTCTHKTMCQRITDE